MRLPCGLRGDREQERRRDRSSQHSPPHRGRRGPNSFPTSGPTNRFKYALFIEKEGFDPLLERAQIAEKYNMAIFSSKGMSVIAARTLVDHPSQAGVTVFVLHDFDRAGLLIAHWFSHDSHRPKSSLILTRAAA